MRAHVLRFVDRLRRDGVRISVAESLDALAAVAAVGVERETLRDGLAVTLVKDERDRAAFETRFDEWFPLVTEAEREPGAGRRRRRRTPGGGGDGGSGGAGTAGRGAAGRGGPAASSEPARRAERRGAEPGEPDAARGRRDGAASGDGMPLSAAAREAALRRLPLQEFTARDVQEARALVAVLGRRLRARLARRRRRAQRGELDLRRTLRASIASGGVPLALRRRRRTPRRPDLLALCDLSGSVAAASELLLGLLAPAADHFRRVACFAYVDRLCPIAIEHGHVTPDGPLDLWARSDFGLVLDDLWRTQGDRLTRQTVVLILGDARNNRRPPRPDILRAVRDRVRAVYWVIPEPHARWDTGDSVLRLYSPVCDRVMECLTLDDLTAAVQQLR